MLKLAIIIGSTRPGRVGEAVARWVYELAQKRGDAEFKLVDIKDFNLPLLDEPVPPSQGKYSKEHTKNWAAKIASFDGYVFVTPEYNHGISGALKNAIDFLYAEWNNKAAGFVGYGSAGGARAVEHLRLVMAEVQVATVRNQVALSLFTDFENFTTFKPASYHEKSVNQMLDQLVAWGGAMKTLRRGDVQGGHMTKSGSPKTKVLHAGEGKMIAAAGDLYRFLGEGEDTSQSYAIWEAVVPPGGGPPPHVQTREDEGFYVLEGEITFVADGQKVIARKGSYLNVPRSVVHSFKNESDSDARMLLLVAPAGMEKMFEETGKIVSGPSARPSPSTPQELEKMASVAAKYGIEFRPHGG